MNYLFKYLIRKYNALNYLLWGKFIVKASLYEYVIDNSVFNVSPRITGRYITIDENNFEEYRRLFLNENMDLILERIYVHHDKCITFVVGTEIAYRMFMSTRRTYFEPAINANYEIPTNAVFLYDSQTKKEYEGMSIYSSSFSPFFSLALTLGKKRVLACVLDTNIVPSKTLRRFKFKVIQKNIYVPSLGITKSWGKH
ncbi:MAG: hypothetical protein JZU65_04150 [Chlorobium sp.]|nr:hypothetical protein [Chlorobium sp.]